MNLLKCGHKYEGLGRCPNEGCNCIRPIYSDLSRCVCEKPLEPFCATCSKTGKLPTQTLQLFDFAKTNSGFF